RLRDACIQFTCIDDMTPSIPGARLRHKYGTLVFVGRSSVHPLFDFIVNSCASLEPGPLSIMHDVPTILSSSTPFLHASIKSLQVRTAEFTMAISAQKMHELVITGPLLPHALYHL